MKWTKKSGWIIGGILLSSALTLTLCLTLIHPAANSSETRLTAARQKDTSLHSMHISARSVEIYQRFVTQIVPAVFAGQDENKSFSLVDSFVNLALLAKTSGASYQSAILGLLNCSLSELDVAVKELIDTAGIPYEKITRDSNQITGGFVLNSIWMDRELSLRENNDAMLTSLEDNYYTDLFHTRPTSQLVNDYNQKMTPAVFGSIPEVEIDSHADAAIVSCYDVLDGFSPDRVEAERTLYESHKHRFDFTRADGGVSQVDYLTSTSRSYEKLGEHFTGVDTQIVNLGFSIYKPNDGYGLSSIVSPIVAGQFSRQDYGLDNNGKAIVPICTSKLPYFNANSEIQLMPLYQTMGMSCFDGNTSGALCELVKDDMVVFQIFQKNICTLDYHGFIAKSVTVTLMATTAADPGGQPTYFFYDYNADKPFVFSLTLPLLVDNQSVSLPLVYGTIVNPTYEL